MQLDFHYYATYAAACLAGYEHDESLRIAWSAQFVDCCTRTILKKIGGPLSAATTQSQTELLDAGTDLLSLQDITRIWASFHFLPGDLYADRKRCSRKFLGKYRLICGPNGPLLADTVETARGKGPEAAGIAMHVLADTWAHRYFAGTPSLAINNTNYHFYEIEGETTRQIQFNHNPLSPDDPEKGFYTNSIFQWEENSIMNLGHGRAGHLPDYSYARYKYMPAWGEYREILKDNPEDYMHAFCQMIYAMKCLRDESPGTRFETERCEESTILPYRERIRGILEKRQTDASEDWKTFGESVSGQIIPDFDPELHDREYMDAEEGEKGHTVMGRFIEAALAQKSMVTHRIYSSGNLLAGITVDNSSKVLKRIGESLKLVR